MTEAAADMTDWTPARRRRAGKSCARSTPSPGQRRVLVIIHESIRDRGFPPTNREISVAMGNKPNSTNAPAEHLAALERKGYVVVTRETARGVRLTEMARAELGVGAVPAVVWKPSDSVRLNLEGASPKAIRDVADRLHAFRTVAEAQAKQTAKPLDALTGLQRMIVLDALIEVLEREVKR